jgi:septum formation protein
LYHASVLVLASESPRRRELLALAGFDFIVRARPVAEVRAPGEPPVDYVRRLAREKARAAEQPIRIAAQHPVRIAALQQSSDEILLGADTVVVLGERVLEKPADANDAKSMLRALSGRDHVVITGVCLLQGDREIVDSESTRVHFVEWSDREIDDYVGTGEPMDKAGAYAIQGLASRFVDRIEGCYFNVMGLPLAMVYRHWKTLQTNGR